MIRDTSGQDRVLAKPAISRPWRRRLSAAAVAVVVIGGLGYVVRGWLASSRSVERSRIRIAKVERGTSGARRRRRRSRRRREQPDALRDRGRHGRLSRARRRSGDARPGARDDLEPRPAEPADARASARSRGSTRASDAPNLDIEHGRANADELVARGQRRSPDRAARGRRRSPARHQGVIAELELRRAEDPLQKAEIVVKHAQDRGRALDQGARVRSRHEEADARPPARDRRRAPAPGRRARHPVTGRRPGRAVAGRAARGGRGQRAGGHASSTWRVRARDRRCPTASRAISAIGMSAEIRDGTTTFPGRVRSVSPEVVDGNVATRLEFVDKRPAGLRQNQRLTARILIEERQNVLKVERGPFVDTGGGNSRILRRRRHRRASADPDRRDQPRRGRDCLGCQGWRSASSCRARMRSATRTRVRIADYDEEAACCR